MLEWFDINEVKIPLGVPVLVYLKEPTLQSNVHTAIFKLSDFGIVAGHFDFDMPPITHWARIPNIPEIKVK